ncbi:MAG: T9SS type A sorting domain-containing protein [candidate division Zixibacteria bacterium]|nr:T9SS type A sorting domain-containing protein [candidate division Zixibacteria bacterium]
MFLIILLLILLPSTAMAETYFVDVAESVGLAVYANARGTAVLDANNDGYEDIMVMSHNTQNYLFINHGGAHFVEESSIWGVNQSNRNGESVCVADVNNDGYHDLLCVNSDASLPFLYLNVAGEEFTEIAEYAGLHYAPGGGISGSFVAVTGKSMLDVFVSNRYFAHNGNLQYLDITGEIGLSGCSDIFAPVFIDIDGDIDMDLYLAQNHSSPGHLFRLVDSSYVDITSNNSNGAFPKGEGIAFGDYDNDGDPDLYIGAGYDEPCYLFRNDGTGYFEDVSEESGTNGTPYCRCSTWGDLDHDGDLDLYVVVVEDRRDYLYINQNDGTFIDQSSDLGVDVISEGLGAAFLDYDLDGDLDIFVTGLDEFRCRLYRNETNNDNYLKIRIVGPANNRFGVGAVVYLYEGGHMGDPMYLLGSRYVQSLSGLMSTTSQIVHFGVPGDGPFDVFAAFVSGEPGILYGVHKGTTQTLHSGGIVNVGDEPGQIHPGNFDIGIRCFPTPTNSRVNIEVTADSKSDVVLDMYNIRGQKVRNINVGPVRTTAVKSVDVSDLSSGIYFIRPHETDNTSSAKFVLLK